MSKLTGRERGLVERHCEELGLSFERAMQRPKLIKKILRAVRHETRYAVNWKAA